jgi:hypothetical protein
MGGSDMLQAKLNEIVEKRKKRELSTVEFYHALLKLLSTLADELSAENINEAQVKRQIPLILTFLNSQIKDMANRGN